MKEKLSTEDIYSFKKGKNASQWRWFMRHKVMSAFILAILIIIVASAANSSKMSTTTQQPPSVSSSTPSIPAYSVLADSGSGTLKRVEVYTAATSTGDLIILNDYLLNKYRSGSTHLFIDYFDDKQAADGYFEKQASDNVSEAEKNRLYSHYIANMIYNTDTGYKKLVRQGQNQGILKSY